jgi:hypothetical protein
MLAPYLEWYRSIPDRGPWPNGVSPLIQRAKPGKNVQPASRGYQPGQIIPAVGKFPSFITQKASEA